MFRLLLLWPLLSPTLLAQNDPATVSPPVGETCPKGYTCVPNKDMEVLVRLLEEQKCRADNLPQVEADSVKIIVDRKGRIYGSGDEPYPYTVRMKWCNYQIEARSKLKLQVAQRVEPTWGFRFRPKAFLGYLPLQPFIYDKSAGSGIDAGLMLDFFYVFLSNLNVIVGFRSFGLGVGIDITDNFGATLGGGVTWGEWKPDFLVAADFAF
jgi:hypothetical protein